ncbi:IS3 family transposase [Aliarcobacter butzleri]|uniref:IS3 family transposase n=1 Tax=Aliarcobacter butzleri TaxID=28197 RepID=UPI00396B337F
MERFWRSAKVEKIYLNEYDRVSVLKNDVKDYINFYNCIRRNNSDSQPIYIRTLCRS